MTGIGDKVAHVRRAAAEHQGGRHTCHWPGCGEIVAPAKWGCARHWYKLPKDLRDAIWRTYRPGQEQTKTPSRAYVVAALNVQAWIRDHAAPEPKQETLL